MTPPTQPPHTHCDHECVCGVLMVGGIEGDRSPCDLTGCKHDTRSRPHPAPAHRTYESCHKHFSCPDGEECWYSSADYYWDCGQGAARLMEGRIEAARKAREDAIEKLSDLNKYSCEEYEEANLSDNEREMRIHLEYGNRTWGIIRSLRQHSTQAGDP